MFNENHNILKSC